MMRDSVSVSVYTTFPPGFRDKKHFIILQSDQIIVLGVLDML